MCLQRVYNQQNDLGKPQSYKSAYARCLRVANIKRDPLPRYYFTNMHIFSDFYELSKYHDEDKGVQQSMAHQQHPGEDRYTKQKKSGTNT